MEDREIAADEFARGHFALQEGHWAEAHEAFRAAHDREPSNARFRSYYGLAFGIVERRFQEASQLCASAAKQEFFNPDMYLNLARLYLSFGFKSEGVRYLRRGRMIDPGHEEIARELQRLGRRARPTLPFLPRSHALNRWIGLARTIFARTRTASA